MMDAPVYNTRAWRDLPRDRCVVADLFGEAVGPCAGRIDRHHIDRVTDRTVPVCASHHPKLEAALRFLINGPKRRRCRHRHRYPWVREECERRLNADAPDMIAPDRAA